MRTNRALRLAIFNHKGGVGKTTLTVNISAALASQGKTVLLIDSDPQCNLTSYLIEDSVIDDWLNKSDGAKGRTVWSALKPVVEGRGALKQIPAYGTSTDNMYLLPGDIRLSDYELELAKFWTSCMESQVRGFLGTTSLSRLIDTCAGELRADFVFYDTGPNIGPLNRAILLDCDYFIVPGACDLFSVRALKTLGKTVKEWVSRWETIKSLVPTNAPLLEGQPRFLGYILQGFRVYGRGMARTPARYRAMFKRHLFTDLITPLRKMDRRLASTNVSASDLGEIKDFATLVQQSQSQGVPLWEVYGGAGYQTEQAYKLFSKIAQAIISKTQRK